jgi:hypothetical protein
MPKLLLLNHIILFLCCSIYLGTGLSLVLFQFPLEPKLTIDNYYLIFVEPVIAATHFFTYMTIVMLLCATIMLVTEFLSGIRWVPLIVLAGIIASTVLTTQCILPLNDKLAAGIKAPQELVTIFHSWANLNRVRFSLWSIQWSAMMYWFYRLAYAAREDR